MTKKEMLQVFNQTVDEINKTIPVYNKMFNLNSRYDELAFHTRKDEKVINSVTKEDLELMINNKKDVLKNLNEEMDNHKFCESEEGTEFLSEVAKQIEELNDEHNRVVEKFWDSLDSCLESFGLVGWKFNRGYTTLGNNYIYSEIRSSSDKNVNLFVEIRRERKKTGEIKWDLLLNCSSMGAESVFSNGVMYQRYKAYTTLCESMQTGESGTFFTIIDLLTKSVDTFGDRLAHLEDKRCFPLKYYKK